MSTHHYWIHTKWKLRRWKWRLLLVLLQSEESLYELFILFFTLQPHRNKNWMISKHINVRESVWLTGVHLLSTTVMLKHDQQGAELHDTKTNTPSWPASHNHWTLVLLVLLTPLCDHMIMMMTPQCVGFSNWPVISVWTLAGPMAVTVIL